MTDQPQPSANETPSPKQLVSPNAMAIVTATKMQFFENQLLQTVTTLLDAQDAIRALNETVAQRDAELAKADEERDKQSAHIAELTAMVDKLNLDIDDRDKIIDNHKNKRNTG